MNCFLLPLLIFIFTSSLWAVTYFKGDIAQTVYELMPGEGTAYNGPVPLKVKVTKERDLQCAERPSNTEIYKCRAPTKDEDDRITLEGNTAKTLFTSMLKKNPGFMGFVLAEGGVSCQKSFDAIPSYQCTIQL